MKWRAQRWKLKNCKNSAEKTVRLQEWFVQLQDYSLASSFLNAQKDASEIILYDSFAFKNDDVSDWSCSIHTTKSMFWAKSHYIIHRRTQVFVRCFVSGIDVEGLSRICWKFLLSSQHQSSSANVQQTMINRKRKRNCEDLDHNQNSQ